MGNLAAAYRTAGNLDRALPLFEETLKLTKAKLGLENPLTLRTMVGLARAYQDAGKLNQSLPLCEEALKLTQANLGPDHSFTVDSMAALAWAYQMVGKPDLALPLFLQALALRKAKFGPDHPDTISSMSNLGSLYWQMRQCDKAIPLHEEVLKSQVARFGREHPETLITLGNLGCAYKDGGRPAEAVPLLEEAYRASKKYPNFRGIEMQLFDGYIRAGKTQQAAALVPELSAIARKTLPNDSPQLASQLASFGLLLLKVKSFTEALPLIRECLAIREKMDPVAWTTFNTKSMLGMALLGQKKYAEAEPLLLAGYDGMKRQEDKIPAQGKVRLTEAAVRLVQLYEATGKPGEAAKWRKELEAIPATQKTPERHP